jgi:dTDP-4-amino-4,6-dideoxygalactose transaminase
MRSGWLTTGPEAMAFEEEFAAVLNGGAADSRGETGKPVQTLCVNSATSGLHLALEAAGVGPGDCVAVPSLTFTATAEIVRYLGADPLFIDSEPVSGNMNPDILRMECRKAVDSGRRVRAVIPVHLAGYPCRMEALRRAVKDTGAVIVEDAAHAFPSRTPEGMAGTLADIGVFSFYATKTITTGEGGLVATRNPEFLERMRLMRLHGIDRAVWNRYSENAGSKSWEYDVTAPGFKYNMTDIAAAIGRVQLRRSEDLLNKRKTLVNNYNRNLRDVPQLELPSDTPGHAWHLYIVRLSGNTGRDELAGELDREGIGSSVHFIPLHEMTYWKNSCKLQASDFPVAADLGRRSLSLPLWPGLSVRAQKKIIDVVRRVLHG